MALRTVAFVLGLVSLLPASTPFAPDETLGFYGFGPSWDPLSREVIAGILDRVEDSSALVRHARAASCAIDYSMWTEGTFFPIRASLQFAWDDADGSGTIGGHEIETETLGASDPTAWPLLWDLRERLWLQTALGGATFFSLHNVRTVKVAGGYRMRLELPWDWWLRRSLGYDVLYVTVGDDFRPTQARARCIDGSGWVADLRHVRHGDKWLSAGYHKVTTGWGIRTEEDRRDEYADADGVPVLRRISIRTSFFSIAGLISTRQEFSFRDWRIQRRSNPLPALGADPNAGDPDEGLFPGPGPLRELREPLRPPAEETPRAPAPEPEPERKAPIEVRGPSLPYTL